MRWAICCLLVGLWASALLGDDPESPVSFTERQLKRIRRLSPLGSPPTDPTNAVADDPRAQRLGRQLFFDSRLSGNGEISCSTCHDPEQYFQDGKKRAKTLKEMQRNTPTLQNSAWLRNFFWDGRATTIWGQAIEPIESPFEMGGDRLEVLHRLDADEAFKSAFIELFGEWPTLSDAPPRAYQVDEKGRRVETEAWRKLPKSRRFEIDHAIAQVGKLLGAFQRSLVTGETPFDRFVRTLSSQEVDREYPLAAQRGLALFVGKARCHQCHHGPIFSDQSFHATQVAPPEGLFPDEGRYGARRFLKLDQFGAGGRHSDDPDGKAARRARGAKITGGDFGAFRTPGLRNVSRTAPYMHAGQFETLEEVISFYSDRIGALPPDPDHLDPLNQPLNLSAEEQADLLAFLLSLTD